MWDFILRSAKSLVPVLVGAGALIAGAPAPENLAPDAIAAVEQAYEAVVAITSVVGSVLTWLMPNKPKANKKADA